MEFAFSLYNAGLISDSKLQKRKGFPGVLCHHKSAEKEEILFQEGT